MQKFVGFYNSPLGAMVLYSDGVNLTGLYFETSVNLHNMVVDSSKLHLDSSTDSRKDSHFGKSKCTNLADLPIFTQTKEWLDLYFNGKIPRFTPPIAFPKDSSRFALRVWEILLEIPYGATMTYGDIAKQVAREFGIDKMSAQAVGGAVSRNPISIIVPCHRVLGANLNIKGYAGGIDKKLALLQIEGNDIKCFKMPKNKI